MTCVGFHNNHTPHVLLVLPRELTSVELLLLLACFFMLGGWAVEPAEWRLQPR